MLLKAYISIMKSSIQHQRLNPSNSTEISSPEHNDDDKIVKVDKISPSPTQGLDNASSLGGNSSIDTHDTHSSSPSRATSSHMPLYPPSNPSFLPINPSSPSKVDPSSPSLLFSPVYSPPVPNPPPPTPATPDAHGRVNYNPNTIRRKVRRSNGWSEATAIAYPLPTYPNS